MLTYPITIDWDTGPAMISYEERRYEVPTAVSVQYDRLVCLPTETTIAIEGDELDEGAVLDWMTLTIDALPNSRSMSAAERDSINEFFWSHFE